MHRCLVMQPPSCVVSCCAIASLLHRPPRADMRQLAADSLELLSAALPASLLRRFPALLTLPVWGSIIGARWQSADPGHLAVLHLLGVLAPVSY